mmetsp:Transcript_55498/g.119379  ORF Transcript_55498/g.119379 Transcript_55498/m.119379 type:complete len:244 (+) Transcript_55498:704-1435(+)
MSGNWYVTKTCGVTTPSEPLKRRLRTLITGVRSTTMPFGSGNRAARTAASSSATFRGCGGVGGGPAAASPPGVFSLSSAAPHPPSPLFASAATQLLATSTAPAGGLATTLASAEELQPASQPPPPPEALQGGALAALAALQSAGPRGRDGLEGRERQLLPLSAQRRVWLGAACSSADLAPPSELQRCMRLCREGRRREELSSGAVPRRRATRNHVLSLGWLAPLGGSPAPSQALSCPAMTALT